MTQNGPQFLFGTEIVWSVQEIHTVKILSSNAKDLLGNIWAINSLLEHTLIVFMRELICRILSISYGHLKLIFLCN